VHELFRRPLIQGFSLFALMSGSPVRSAKDADCAGALIEMTTSLVLREPHSIPSNGTLSAPSFLAGRVRFHCVGVPGEHLTATLWRGNDRDVVCEGFAMDTDSATQARTVCRRDTGATRLCQHQIQVC